MAFEDWWKSYPRRIGKLDAEKAYTAALKKGADEQAMLHGAKAFAALLTSRGTDRAFIPYPASWIRAGRWLDEELKVTPAETAPFIAQTPASWNGTENRLIASLGPSGAAIFQAYFSQCELEGKTILAPSEARKATLDRRFWHKLEALGLKVEVR